jgi:hypothetical protein
MASQRHASASSYGGGRERTERGVPNHIMNPAKRVTGAVSKLVRLRFGLRFARRGDGARQRADWIGAVVEYRRALDWMPWREDLKIQIGNCLKEFGDLGGAIAAYRSVSVQGNRAEALIQIADAERREGFTTQAFFTAADATEWVDSTAFWDSTIEAALLPGRIKLDALEPRRWLGTLGQLGVPRRKAGSSYVSIKLDQVGAMSIEREGLIEPLFAGIVAIRGRVLSLRAVPTVEILLGDGGDAKPVASGATHTVKLERSPLKLHVFNIWIDSASLPRGRHWLSVSASGTADPTGLFVTVADVGEPEVLAGSNAFVASPSEPVVSCTDYVRELPSVARPARRAFFDRNVRSLLAIRADQLGDVSASLPALQRLRGLFPSAHITALVQPTVRAVVEVSGIVDEVLTVSLPYDHQTERRYLDPAEEQRLTDELSTHLFDLAIDLSPGSETRPLLLMSKANYLVGFDPDRFSFLDFGISIRSRDKVNLLERNAHAVNVLALVEALGLVAAAGDRFVTRAASSGEELSSVDLTGSD